MNFIYSYIFAISCLLTKKLPTTALPTLFIKSSNTWPMYLLIVTKYVLTYLPYLHSQCMHIVSVKYVGRYIFKVKSHKIHFACLRV